MSAKDIGPERTLPRLPGHWLSLGHAFVHQARARPFALAIADSTGAHLTYQRSLVAAIALANLLHSTLNQTTCVGVLLPPSAGAAIANLAVMLLGKVPVNLNYTCGQGLFDASVAECDAKQIVSSDRFLKRLDIEPKRDVIRLEDVQEDILLTDKIKAWSEAEIVPERLLGHMLPGLVPYHKMGLSAQSGVVMRGQSIASSRLTDPASIIFTAGSTGIPKGVVLSHSNVLSNIHAIRLQGHVQPGEVVLGVIPFFHSFGLTMTLWAPLCLGETVVYHYDPLDARRIGELCESFKATTLICTPTMMSLYLRRCRPEQFNTIRACILGGEKLKRQELLDIERTLGKTPLEGYGLAETSPVISCNVPGEVTLPDGHRVSGTKPGTVGRPLPGTAIRVVDVDSGKDLPRGGEGMILVSGPQVMMGYLNKPDATAKVLKDGWLTTGDIGFLDRDGFLTITGRLSQFSKIGGEMVPHLAVEDELMRLTAAGANELCVTSVPDDRRGERLVVVYSNLETTPAQVIEKLRATNMPRLWIPEPLDFIRVSELPVLRNGKLDLRAIKQIAVERCSRASAAS